MSLKEDFKQEVYENFRRNFFEHQLQLLAKSQLTPEQKFAEMRNMCYSFLLRYDASQAMAETIIDIFNNPIVMNANNDMATNMDNFWNELNRRDVSMSLLLEIQQFNANIESDKKIVQEAQKINGENKQKLTPEQIRIRQDKFNENIAQLRLYLMSNITNPELKKVVYKILNDPIILNVANDAQTNSDNFWNAFTAIDPSQEMVEEALKFSKEINEHITEAERLAEEQAVAEKQRQRQQEFAGNISRIKNTLNNAGASTMALNVIMDVLEDTQIINAQNDSNINYQNFMTAINREDYSPEVYSEITNLIELGRQQKLHSDAVETAMSEALATAERENAGADVSALMPEYDALARSLSAVPENNEHSVEGISFSAETQEEDTLAAVPTMAASPAPMVSSVEDASVVSEETRETDEISSPETISSLVDTYSLEATSPMPEVVSEVPQASVPSIMPQQGSVSRSVGGPIGPIAPAPAVVTTVPNSVVTPAPTQAPTLSAAAIQQNQQLQLEAVRRKKEDEERRKMEEANFLVKMGDWIQRNIFDRIGDSIPLIGTVIKMIGNVLTGLLKTIGHMFDRNWGEAGKTGLSWLKDTAIVGGATIAGYAFGKQFGWWGKKSDGNADKNLGIAGTATSVIGTVASGLLPAVASAESPAPAPAMMPASNVEANSSVSTLLQNQSGLAAQNAGLRERLSSTGSIENSAAGEAIAYTPTSQKTNC